MPVWKLDERLIFPDPSLAEPDGLLAISDDIAVDRLMVAYQSGIFPWFSYKKEFYWFSPNPRCVLIPDEIIVSKSMKQLIKKNTFQVKVNHDFEAVIKNCATIKRKGDNDTWINKQFQKAYIQLHQLGIAHSIEVYEDDNLIGGLYGLAMGAAFFGESMFSKKSNASKYAFIFLATELNKLNFKLIDCQVYNDHLASMGAKDIPRDQFLSLLNEALTAENSLPFNTLANK